jgi:DNA-binding response OmpR family regulator
MKILYLEDDTDLAATIQEYLESKGFEVIVVYDGKEALAKSYEESFDIFIFDVKVPKLSGFELLKNLRQADIDTPTIFTTSLNSIENLSEGYTCGADDYLKKPFSLEELYLRIQALLKREYKSIDNIIKIDKNILFDTNAQKVKIGEDIFDLNNKETQLLKLLIKNKNHCVLFDNIFDTVWSFENIHSEQSLRTYIKNLRKVLGKEKIVSIKKQGYMFV